MESTIKEKITTLINDGKTNRQISDALNVSMSTVLYHREEKYRLKKNETRQARRNSIKRELVKAAGGKCVKCGYDKCVASLDFHHVNPEEKDPTPFFDSLNKGLKEIKKCILVCSNCHREIHFLEK